jgi:hypothetical protein
MLLLLFIIVFFLIFFYYTYKYIIQSKKIKYSNKKSVKKNNSIEYVVVNENKNNEDVDVVNNENNEKNNKNNEDVDDVVNNQNKDPSILDIIYSISKYFQLNESVNSLYDCFILCKEKNEDFLYFLFMNHKFSDKSKKLEIGTYIIWNGNCNNKQIFDIYNEVVKISSDKNEDKKIRSTAVDILLRSNNTYYIYLSKKILEELRKDERIIYDRNNINEVRNNINNLRQNLQINKSNIDINEIIFIQEQIAELQNHETNLNRNKNMKQTIYSDSQNVHDHNINETVLSAANSLVNSKNTTTNIVQSSDVISELIKYYPLYEKNKIKIENSLNRIKTDGTIFRNNIRLSIFYDNIKEYIDNSKYKSELYKRLGEELTEMNGLCSTGFLSRLLNVIQGFPELPDNLKLNINPKDEIYSSIQTYLNKEIMDDENSDKILDALSSLDYNDNRQIIVKFISEKIKVKYPILFNEYVNSKIIDKTILNLNIEDSLNNYLKNEAIVRDIIKLSEI